MPVVGSRVAAPTTALDVALRDSSSRSSVSYWAQRFLAGDSVVVVVVVVAVAVAVSQYSMVSSRSTLLLAAA